MVHCKMSDSEMSKPTTGHRKRNLSIGSLCLGSMCIGLTVGWPQSSLSYVILTNCDDACYDLPTSGSSTIQIIMNFGSCIGALLPSYIADVYGRRFAFSVAAVLNFTFWTMLAIWQTHIVKMQIICSAALGGFATGIFVTTTALYISEISLPSSRGTTGALTAFFAYSGALFGSCLIFITYNRIISSIMALLAVMFLISVRMWMVESPYYFFMQSKTLEAKLSLKDLRGTSTVLEVDEEFRTIELFHRKRCEAPKNDQCNTSVSQVSPRKRKCAMLGLIFFCIAQMVGAYGVDNYSEKFLNGIVPYYGRVVIASLDLCSVAICICIIEKFGRPQILLVISIVGSSVSCLIMGIVTLTDYGGTAPKRSERSLYLLAAILGLYYLVYTLGLTPILPVLTGEIFPSRGKTLTIGFSISFIYLCSMAIQATHETLNEKQGSDLAFASFAIVGSLGIPVAFLFIPDTRGKTLHEIQNELEDCTILIS